MLLPPLTDITLRLHLDLRQCEASLQLCARHHRDVGDGEGADRLGGGARRSATSAQNIAKWTDEALKAIGLTAGKLLEPDTVTG